MPHLSNTPSNSEPNPQLSLLVVDDDPLIRLHLKLALGKTGFAVTEAVSGEHALRLAQALPFDVVLMDVRMPGLDGFSACQQLKALPLQTDTQVVMLTGTEDLASIDRATQVGATDYVIKPLNTTVLSRRLKHIVQARRDCSALESERAHQQALLNAIPDMFFHFNAKGRLLAARLPQQTPGLMQERAVAGACITHIFPISSRFDAHKAMRQALAGECITHEVHCPQIPDSAFEVRLVASGTDSVICTVRDATEQMRQKRQIEKMSLLDTLTGLPNRACLLQVTQRQLQRAPEQPLCLVHLSFSNIANTRNSLGSATADRLTRVIAHKLLKLVRSSIPKHAKTLTRVLLAHTSDSDFHLLLPDSAGHVILEQALEALNKVFSRPIKIDQYEFAVPLLSGVALSVHAHDAEQLLTMSGVALQQASLSASSNRVFYTPEFEQQRQRRLQLETQLRKAIEQGSIELVYQPKVCALTRQIKSVEALARWYDSELGFISPVEFIPLAEESGLILPLGDLIMEKACRQSQQWKQQGQSHLPIAINVSAHQFNQRNVDERLFRLLDRLGLNPRAVELEITESALIEQQQMHSMLLRLRERGVRIAIDDFGTGYSSLSMLQDLPVDILKIDRAFVSVISDAQTPCSIVDAVIALGHSLNLTLVAEGVETETQLTYLQNRGCQLIQGYLTGRPMAAQQIIEQYCH